MSDLITQQGDSRGVSIYRNIADPLAFCTEIGKSLAVTFGLNSPHHGTVMALTCLSEGISPTIYFQRYHADGSMRASSMQAEYMRRGGAIEWIDLGDDSKQAKAVFSHPLLKTPLTIAYTIEEARRQVGDKFDKPGSNWATNPGAMLRAALIRKAAKIIDPGIVGGYDAFEEFSTEPLARPAKAPVVNTVIVPPEVPAAVQPVNTVHEMQDENGNPDPPLTSHEKAVIELFALARKLPSPGREGELMNDAEITAKVLAACKCERIEDAPEELLRQFIERIKAKISQA